jgi:hypothetical protein
MADFRDYLELEIGLSTRLAKVWKPYAARVYAQITQSVAERDFARAHEIANAIDLTDLMAEQEPFIRATLLTCAQHGAAIAGGTGVSLTELPKLLDGVVRGFLSTIEYQVSRQVSDAAAQLIADAQAEDEQAQQVFKAAKPRFVKEFVTFKRSGDAALQMVSALHTSRLSTWGFTAEAEYLGFDEYELSAVLDGRTSEFCRLINGKRFKVVDARSSIINVLSVAQPEDAKTVQPWPKQNKAVIALFKEMTPTELTELGLHIPPFHPGCRTMLVRAGKAPKLEKPKVTAPSMPETVVTPESFKALGLDVGQDKVDHWNTYVKLNPVDVLAKLSGHSPVDLVNGTLGQRFRTIMFSDSGDVQLKFIARAGEKGIAGSKLTFNPYSGVLYKDYLDFKGASQVDAQAFFRKFEDSLAEVGKSLGAEKIITAVGAGQAVAYGKIGYVPQEDDWIILRTSLKESLQDVPEMLAKLKPNESEVLNLLLTSSDPRAFRALVDMPFGKKLVKTLLADAEFDGVLDLTDLKVLAKHKGIA